MPTDPNQGVPKTFMYGLVNPTPESSTNVGQWVPIVTTENGEIQIIGQAQPRPGVSVFTDVKVTSAQANELRNDNLDPGSDTVLGFMAQDVNAFGLVVNNFAAPQQFGGSDSRWNRQRGNENPIYFSSATYNATQETGSQQNINARGLHVIVNVTDIFGGTPSIVLRIQARDPAVLSPSPPEFYDLLVSLAITATGRNVFKVYPGIGTIPNAAASDILPWQYNIRIEHADAQNIEYSVAGNLVV